MTAKELKEWLERIKIIIVENQDFNCLFSREHIKLYYDKRCIKRVRKLFQKFQDLRMEILTETGVNNNSLDINSYIKINSNTDKILNITCKRIKQEEWLNEFVSKVNVAVTYDEGIYFLKSIFEKVSEEKIAEYLAVSTSTLYDIKRSCFLKLDKQLLEIK